MRQASVFLVEDEVLIGMMLADMIEQLGHRVVAEAANIQDGQTLARTANYDLAVHPSCPSRDWAPAHIRRNCWPGPGSGFPV
jgi:hypothetical protein